MAKQIIKLIKRDIKEIMAKTVKRVLNKSSSVDDIDIAQIPIEILKQGYFDYRLIPQSIMYGSILHQPPKKNKNHE